MPANVAGPGDLAEIEAETAPARADIEHALAGIEQELRGDMPFLRQLRLFEGRVRVVEIGAGILPVAVEEEGVEAPVEVVMVGDVPPGAFRVVLAAPLHQGSDAPQPAERQPPEIPLGILKDEFKKLEEACRIR